MDILTSHSLSSSPRKQGPITTVADYLRKSANLSLNRQAAAYGSLRSQGRRTDKILIDRPDQRLDLVGVRAELLGELVEIGIGDLLEARLVAVLDDLDAHLLEFGCRRVLHLEGPLRLLDTDVPRGGQHPLLLFVIEALPQLVADPHDAVISLMPGHRHDRR